MRLAASRAGLSIVATLLGVLASVTFASAATTVTCDPGDCIVPNDPTYTNDALGECEVYDANAPSLPIASLDNSPFCQTSGVLTSVAWGAGSFDGATPGDFIYVQPRTVGCTNLSYSACASANADIPGSLEADFTLISGGGSSSSTATSTLSAADALMTYLLFVLDGIWFALVFVAVVAALGFIFYIKK